MISCIKVISRIQMLFAIEDAIPIFGNYKWHLISICTLPHEAIACGNNLNVLRDKMNCVEVLPLVFADFSLESFNTFRPIYELEGKFPFNKEQAKQVLEFAMKIDERMGDEKILIHCDGGISRSGAVGTFLCEYFGLNYDEFKSKNKSINPNSYVLDILRQEAGLKISAKNSAFNAVIAQ